jgi:hypothetical protein
MWQRERETEAEIKCGTKYVKKIRAGARKHKRSI